MTCRDRRWTGLMPGWTSGSQECGGSPSLGGRPDRKVHWTPISGTTTAGSSRSSVRPTLASTSEYQPGRGALRVAVFHLPARLSMLLDRTGVALSAPSTVRVSLPVLAGVQIWLVRHTGGNHTDPEIYLWPTGGPTVAMGHRLGRARPRAPARAVAGDHRVRSDQPDPDGPGRRGLLRLPAAVATWPAGRDRRRDQADPGRVRAVLPECPTAPPRA
jgi:hypothetical protein